MRLPSVSIYQPTIVRKGVRSKGSIWWMAWRDANGKQTRESTGAKIEKVARRIAHEKEMDLAFPRPVDPTAEHADMTWARFKREFIDRYAASKADATSDAFDYCLKAFERTVSPIRLRDVNAKMLADFVTKRLATGVSPQTVDKELRHLRTALNRAVEWSYIPVAPRFKGVFVGNQEGDRRVVPQADIDAIIKALDDPALPVVKCSREWWRTFFQLTLFCGARIGEVLGLRWSRVDFDAQTLTIFHTTSKGRRTRVYPNAGNLLTVLRAWRDSQQPTPEPTDPVFPFTGTARNLYVDWHSIQTHAGIPVERHHRPKDLRSTCATQMIEDGTPTLVVKDWLGHRSVLTTERFYARTDRARREAAAKRQVVA